MMKRLITPLLIIIFLFSILGYAHAGSSKIEISFKLGSDTVTIDGKSIKTQKSFRENGVVMAASQIFTEAFGAEIQYHGSDKSVDIKYSDVTIKLFVGQKTAILNGDHTSILQGPLLKENTLMLPVKFVAENFGAQCTFDNQTQEIKVEKDLAGDKSIKDFSLILKKTVKAKVGDSYYKWNMNFPKELKITDRSFDGTNTCFESADGSYQIYINIYPKNDDTIDTLMAKDRDNLSDYILVSQTKGKKDSYEYSQSIFKNEEVWEVRNYLKDDWVFELSLYMEDYTKYMESTVDHDVLDSFSLSYPAGNQMEDLSDVNPEGFRTYEDKNLKFTIDVAAEWLKNEYDTKYNTIQFSDPSDNNQTEPSILQVNMFSYQPGFTLDNWRKWLLQYLKDTYNPDYYKILKEENGQIDGVPCKKVYYLEISSGKTIYACDAFLLGENYKYDVYYRVNADVYHDPKKLARFEKALTSFRFTEPDAKKIGPLMDPADIEQSNTKISKKNQEYKWSCEIPADFTPDEGNNNQDKVYYNNHAMSFHLTVLKDVQVDNMVEYLDEEFAKGVKLGAEKSVNKQIINAKGIQVYQYTLLSQMDQMVIKSENYLLNKNGFLYVVNIDCPEMYLSEKNKNQMEEFWQSLKIE